MTDLSGRVALVTGAQQGIGRAVAEHLAAAGAAVVVNHLDGVGGRPDQDRIGEVVEACAAFGARVVAVQADVSTRAGCEVAVAAGEQLGGVDLLVNNAGIFPRTPLLDLTDDEFSTVLDTNLGSTFRCTQLVARGLVERKRSGAIVNLASIAAYRPSPRGAHYAASKAGIVGFTHTAAVELGPHQIRINSVAPGLVDTAQPRYGMTEDEIATASASVPLGRMATPGDIADVVVFLLSDQARHVTGQTLHINGGQYTV
jgi:NAD(P)-dependent dehydrogenase (short-subunit alcohol dehydrogenase family)